MSFYLHYPKLLNATAYKLKTRYFLVTEHGKSLIDPRLLRRIDMFFKQGLILKDSPTTTAVLAAVSNDGDPVFLKRTNNKGLRFTVRYLFRPARAFRAAYAAQCLEAAGIRTPEVLLVGEHRIGPILRSGYLVTASDPEIQSVSKVVRENSMPEIFLESFLEYAGKTMAKLHGNHLVHGDLKIVNFYYAGTWSPDHEEQYGIWDLDSVTEHHKFPPKAIVERELSRTVFSLILAAEQNSCFLPEFIEIHKITKRLLKAYLPGMTDGMEMPDEEEICRLAQDRLDYRHAHPYEDRAVPSGGKR